MRRLLLSLTLLLLLASRAHASDVTTRPVTAANPLRAIAKERLRAFVEAPLFSPARRQQPTNVTVTPPQSPAIAPREEPPPNIHLVGIIHGSHDLAIVRSGDDQKTITVANGDHLGPWTVTMLSTTGIRVSDGLRAFDYALFAVQSDSTNPVIAQRP